MGENLLSHFSSSSVAKCHFQWISGPTLTLIHVYRSEMSLNLSGENSLQFKLIECLSNHSSKCTFVICGTWFEKNNISSTTKPTHVRKLIEKIYWVGTLVERLIFRPIIWFEIAKNPSGVLGKGYENCCKGS